MSKRRRTGNTLVDTVESTIFKEDVSFESPTTFTSVRTPVLTTPTTTLTIGATGKTVDFNNSTVTNFNPPGIPPVGTIFQYVTAFAPDGYLLCNGQLFPIANYPALFALIGYTYGGSGSGFRVPDIRGRAIVGFGQGAGLTNRLMTQTGGLETVTLGVGEIPNHTHTLMFCGDTSTGSSNNHTLIGNGQPLFLDQDSPLNAARDEAITFTGGNGAHENMMPFIVLNNIIKY